MFDLIGDIPVHPLVVHAVVVLLPLAILGTVAIAVRPVWRLRYGHLVVACTLVATALIPVATSSGEQLERRVGNPGEHAELGDQLIWFALPLLVVVTALVVLAHAQRRGDARRAAGRSADGGDAGASAVATQTGTDTRSATRSRLSTISAVVAAVAVVVAVLNGVWVYRVGDSGARAVWADQVGSTTR